VAVEPALATAERYHRLGEGLTLADASGAGNLGAKDLPMFVSLDDLWHVFETGRER
jgi:hypothetical protein